MDLSPQSRPDVSKMNPPPQMWIRCVESGSNESKFDPTSQKRTRHFGPARNGSPVLEIHDPTSKQLTRTRNGLPQPACAFPVAPVHFQMPTLAILASPPHLHDDAS
ncbi:hypothetical protein PAXRUDRAFT_834548 [Paxillus rubicundulus Ve08.2h10]|uniref:Uncharacterized protein n=1 Tax=Paxillus rubicundulus Ve08.2h10 TaxID=930991 RepID=A0A0D0DJX7_9AGAM|nr:hypothetical protein PAXRUDRAFT_834548 [Paxillus rubicundulus Ve08.2h10]